LRGNARAERGRVTFFRSSGRSKALKGEAQERWELKEALQEVKAKNRRKGSQTLKVGTSGNQGNGFRTPHRTVGCKEGRSLLEYAVERRSFSEAFFERRSSFGGFVSRETAGWRPTRRDGGEVQERINRFLTETTDLIEPKTLWPT